MHASSTIHVIHDITGGTRERYENVIARIRREEAERGGDLPDNELLFHVSGLTEDGWRATELWRYGLESYAFRDDLAGRIAEELGAEVRIYAPEFVHIAPRR